MDPTLPVYKSSTGAKQNTAAFCGTFSGTISDARSAIPWWSTMTRSAKPPTPPPVTVSISPESTASDLPAQNASSSSDPPAKAPSAPKQPAKKSPPASQTKLANKPPIVRKKSKSPPKDAPSPKPKKSSNTLQVPASRLGGRRGNSPSALPNSIGMAISLSSQPTSPSPLQHSFKPDDTPSTTKQAAKPNLKRKASATSLSPPTTAAKRAGSIEPIDRTFQRSSSRERAAPNHLKDYQLAPVAA